MRILICLAAFAASTLSAFADVNATFTDGSTTLNFSLPDAVMNYGYPEDFDEVHHHDAAATPDSIGDVIFHGGYWPSYIEGVGPVTEFTDYYFELNGGAYFGAFPGFVTTDTNGIAESLTFVPGTYAYDGGAETLAISETPEPSTLALLGTGLFGAVGVVRRRVVAAV